MSDKAYVFMKCAVCGTEIESRNWDTCPGCESKLIYPGE